MNQQATLDQLRSLRLHGMAHGYEAILAMPVHLQPDAHELLACLLGYKMIYLNMNRFIEKIHQARLDGTFIKLLNQLEKTNLIILDDFGPQPLNAEARLALLQILEDRYRKKSMLIASN